MLLGFHISNLLPTFPYYLVWPVITTLGFWLVTMLTSPQPHLHSAPAWVSSHIGPTSFLFSNDSRCSKGIGHGLQYDLPLTSSLAFSLLPVFLESLDSELGDSWDSAFPLVCQWERAAGNEGEEMICLFMLHLSLLILVAPVWGLWAALPTLSSSRASLTLCPHPLRPELEILPGEPCLFGDL